MKIAIILIAFFVLIAAVALEAASRADDYDELMRDFEEEK